jgi:hypothetical protein
MPAQQCLWGNEEGAPKAAPEQPARGSEEEALRRLRLGSGHVTTQNVKLMAQQDDLELLGLIRSSAQQNQFQHAPRRDVKHRPEHEQTPGSLTKTRHVTCHEARARVYAPHRQRSSATVSGRPSDRPADVLATELMGLLDGRIGQLRELS